MEYIGNKLINAYKEINTNFGIKCLHEIGEIVHEQPNHEIEFDESWENAFILVDPLSGKKSKIKDIHIAKISMPSNGEGYHPVFTDSKGKTYHTGDIAFGEAVYPNLLKCIYQKIGYKF